MIQNENTTGIVTLSLNHPSTYNALSLAMLRELNAVLDALSRSQTCRVIVIQGTGKGFCAGHDLKEVLALKDNSKPLFDLCSQVMLSIENSPKPVIAKIHGAAFAAGCQLVATCDLAIAAEDAVFSTPGINIGLFCSTPMVALSRAVAKKQALEMLLTGDVFSAEKAAKIGLINRAVPVDKLDETVYELAEKIAAKSAHITQLGKAGFYQQLDLTTQQAYAQMAATMSGNVQLSDAQEGINAFLEKRKPAWQQSFKSSD